MICHGQEVPEGLKFEVESVKPVVFSNNFYASGFAAGAARSPCVLGKVAVSGTLISLTRVGICDIIRIAYNVKSFHVFGVPLAVGSSIEQKTQWAPARLSGIPVNETSVLFYDIQARSPGTQSPSDKKIREMLRALLAERFSLKLDREQRTLALYTLVPSAGAPRLKPATTGCARRYSSDSRQICGCTMEQLAHILNDKCDRPVVDMTHISGTFDVEISIDREDFYALVASIRKNLGLKIEARKDPIEVLVVDHVERPSAN